MSGFFAPFSLIIVCLALLFNACNLQPSAQKPPAASPGRQAELKMKQALLEKDLIHSDLLCRTQCLGDLKRAQHELAKKSPSEIQLTLEQLTKEHPHFKQLYWSRHNEPLNQGQQTGKLDAKTEQAVLTYLQKAKQTVKKGKNFLSPSIRNGKRQFIVVGVPAAQGEFSLIGVVEQDFLQKVESHQKRNLRMIPYPGEGQWGIASVDAESLKDVKVRHPEDNQGTSHYYRNEVVVKFKGSLSDEHLKKILRDLRTASYDKLGQTYVFRTNIMDSKTLIRYFRQWDVEYAEPHFLYLTNARNSGTFVPNDSLYSLYQWNLPLLHTEPGWKITRGMKEVIVGVVDTGVDLHHPDLRNKLVSGYNTLNDTDNPLDDVGHGTHVSGIIAANVNNHEGIAGMSWYNRIMPVKVLNHQGAGSTYSVAKGIIWATDHGAKVINLSLGNYVDSDFLHDAIKYAFDRDVVLVAASGNDNTGQPGYPAAYPEVFAVAATDEHKFKAEFSNFGAYIDAAAPGVSIASTFLHNQYAALSGTSMASPHAAALAALIRSVNPLLKNTQVMNIMRKSAQDLGTTGKDDYYGYGLLDVKKALLLAEKSRHSLALWSDWLVRELQRVEQKYAK